MARWHPIFPLHLSVRRHLPASGSLLMKPRLFLSALILSLALAPASRAAELKLEEATIAIRRRVAAYRRAQFRTAGRLARSHAEHDAVVKAIVSAEPARAHAAMLHHVDLVRASFEKLLATAGEAGRPGSI